MSRLLRGEVLKLRTTRTFIGMVLAALALSLLVAVLVAALTKRVTPADARDLVGVDASSLFVLLLGALGMAGEFRHRTITSSVLAVPDRIRLVVAKALAYAAAGVVLSLVVTLVVAGATTLVLAARGMPTVGLADLADQLWRNLVVAALLGALGVAIGTLLRNQVAAIVVVLATLFVVEPTLASVAPKVGRFGPLIGAPSALSGGGVGGGDDPNALGPVAGALVLVAWVAVLGGLGAALLRRRDLV